MSQPFLLPGQQPEPDKPSFARRLVNRLFARWIPDKNEEDLDWASDVEWARLKQEPIRTRAVLRMIGVTLLILIVWAAFAEVDEVARGAGKVTPSRQLQIIQSVDGGVVSDILIREGQIVEPGQILFKVDATRFESSLRENRAQYLALLAKAARLRAIAEGRSFIVPPEVQQESPMLAEQERSLYTSRRMELDTQISIAQQQLAQRSQELNEIRVRRDQAGQGYDLTARELAVTKPLVSAGAVSEVEMLRLERDVSRYRGERDQASAQLVRVQSSISEAHRKIQEIDISFRNEARVELADVMGKLSSLSEGSTALSDRVKHAEVKSAIKGTVKRLMVNTVGGVVQPGTELAEIVPLEDLLLLEVRMQPRDIAFLHPGQKAMVRFTAYDFAIYGALEGVVEHIGADTVIDETDRDKANAYYLVRVRTLKSSLGKNRPIIPGMVAEVDIMTGKKTVLSYLLKPILRAQTHAFTER